MRTPVLRPDRPALPPRKLTLEEACWRAGLSFTPESWGPNQYAEVYLRLLIKGISHAHAYVDPQTGCFVSSARFAWTVLYRAPREARVPVVTAPRRRRRRGSA
jgi:hypothetical protein